MSLSRKVFKNASIQVFGKFTTSAFGLVSRKLLTSYLGPAGFGEFNFALAYSNLFIALSDWGTLIVGVREAAKNPSNRASIFGSTFLLRLAFSALAFAIALICLPFLRLTPALYQVTAFACTLIIFFALKASFGLIFDTLLRQDRWYLVELLTSLTSLTLYALSIYFHLTVIWFIGSMLVSTIIATIVSFVLSRALSPMDLTFNSARVKYLLLESLPMGGVLILFGIYNRLDVLLLNHFRSAAEVGFYTLAYFIYENITIVSAYVMNAVFPILSPQVTASGPTALFKEYFQKVFDLLLVTSMAAVIGTYLFSSLLVSVISTAQFSSSIPLLQILGFAAIFSFLNHLTGYSLAALGKQKPYLLISFFALLLNLLINLIAIPVYGAFAAAWVTVATEAFVQVASYFLIAKSLNRFPSLISFPRTTYQFIITRGRIF